MKYIQCPMCPNWKMEIHSSSDIISSELLWRYKQHFGYAHYQDFIITEHKDITNYINNEVKI